MDFHRHLVPEKHPASLARVDARDPVSCAHDPTRSPHTGHHFRWYSIPAPQCRQRRFTASCPASNGWARETEAASSWVSCQEPAWPASEASCLPRLPPPTRRSQRAVGLVLGQGCCSAEPRIALVANVLALVVSASGATSESHQFRPSTRTAPQLRHLPFSIEYLKQLVHRSFTLNIILILSSADLANSTRRIRGCSRLPFHWIPRRGSDRDRDGRSRAGRCAQRYHDRPASAAATAACGAVSDCGQRTAETRRPRAGTAASRERCGEWYLRTWLPPLANPPWAERPSRTSSRRSRLVVRSLAARPVLQ